MSTLRSKTTMLLIFHLYAKLSFSSNLLLLLYILCKLTSSVTLEPGRISRDGTSFWERSANLRIELSSVEVKTRGLFYSDGFWIRVWPDLQIKLNQNHWTALALNLLIFHTVRCGELVHWNFRPCVRELNQQNPPRHEWKRTWKKLQLSSVVNPSYKATHRTHFPNLWLLLVLNLFRSRFTM